MTNGLTARRLMVAVLACACVSLAVAWPAWRTVLAQVGGYDSSFLGCAGKAGELRVVIVGGPEVSPSDLGAECAMVLNAIDRACEIAAETQSADQKLGTLFRITCSGR